MEINLPKRLLIFASGSGSNAENLIHFFRELENSIIAEVVGIICNNSQAGVIQRAERLDIPCHIISNEQWQNKEFMIELVVKTSPHLIILAGFLKKFPVELINIVNGNVINLHPALLPKFGGKGMYGMNVHKAVIEHKEKETGITIHWVNEHYDEGNIIQQFSFTVTKEDTPETIAHKIHDLEYAHFPEVVKQLLLKRS
ncbi:MAG: phosphoribosylglycinamide formyltransferase [Bacteroidota bacterium]|jgi:phosphoribosylglycinamide formyltransferase-1